MREPLLPPPEWTLLDTEAHVWRAALDAIPAAIEMRSECLSEDERARATLYTVDRERQRFIKSRIVLRHILAAYHGVDPAELRLGREPGGRPYIESADRLFFSLSHSRGTALVAVAPAPVGVDVERVRRITHERAIAARILHPDTVAALESVPSTRRTDAFVDAWTQREAHVKAVGGGLFRTPDALPFDPDQPADGTVRRIASRTDGALWSAVRFEPFAGTRATLVTLAPLEQVRILDWESDAG